MRKSLSIDTIVIGASLMVALFVASNAWAQEEGATPQATQVARSDEKCACVTHDISKIRAALVFAAEEEKGQPKLAASEELEAFNSFVGPLATETLTICAHAKRTFKGYYLNEWETFVIPKTSGCDLLAPRQNVPFLHLQAHANGYGVGEWTTYNSQTAGHSGKDARCMNLLATGIMWFRDGGVKFASPNVLLRLEDGCY